MRWHLLDFGSSVLAVSDQPVVTWAADVGLSRPFTAPRLGPLGAVEVRVPLSDRMAILMTWQDVPDTGITVPADRRFAAEFNAFVVAQADRQWMHRTGSEPDVAPGQFGPHLQVRRASVIRALAPDIETARSRCFFLESVRDQRFIGEIEIADLRWSP